MLSPSDQVSVILILFMKYRFYFLKVFELSNLIKADNCTTPAASLYPYFKQKKIVKTFVIVTDEGENGECEGYRYVSHLLLAFIENFLKT